MFQVFGTQRITWMITDFVMENKWILCQLLFALYMIVLMIMDIKWKKLSLVVLMSGFILLPAGFLCGRNIHIILLAAGAGVGIIFLIVSRVPEEAFG